MANCKRVGIKATVPWDWCSQLDDKDAAFIGRCFVGPVNDLSIRYTELGYVPNEWGGQTAMFEVTIQGVTGMAWIACDRLAQIMAKVGKIEHARAMDTEDFHSNGWSELKYDKSPV